MLRKLLDLQLSLVEKGKPFHKLHPLISAMDTFFYEAPCNTRKGPHIRDAIDLKRWMSIVIISLLPCIVMAIWNTGMQKLVYASGNYQLMNEYLNSSHSFADYFAFASKDHRYLTILKYGLMSFIPVMIISYAVGGLWEGIFACIRGHDIAEGFLVTGMLYPLVLPPTIPYWMVAVGVSAGVILSKELFGGTGMNIMNPALTCRAFLFFTFPGKMSGDVWVGTNPTHIRQSLLKMNQDAGTTTLDAYTQATPLAQFKISPEIKRVHVDAIATNNLGNSVDTFEVIEKQFLKWNTLGQHQATLGKLTPEQMKQFVTASLDQGGLALAPENFESAYHFSSLKFGIGHATDANLFFGNQLGCMGETSTLACLIGALILIFTGVGSWRTILGMILGAFICAFFFQFSSEHLGEDSGAWNQALFSFPAYKHLLMGGLAFGAVYMATDPVSSPGIPLAKWIYGLLIGAIAIIIRAINPAYPEGVMLAILIGNVFAPLIDYYAVRNFRRRHRVTA